MHLVSHFCKCTKNIFVVAEIVFHIIMKKKALCYRIFKPRNSPDIGITFIKDKIALAVSLISLNGLRSIASSKNVYPFQ